MTEEGDTPKQGNSWHFKREISTGDILLAVSIMVMLGVPLLIWGTGLDHRVTYVEAKLSDQQAALETQNILIRDSVIRVENEIRDLNAYLINGRAYPPR